jgi:putative transposase
LIRCLVYIDLNMVRAGVVAHPAQWKVCGFGEIQSSPQRYRIVDQQALCSLTQTPGTQALRTAHKHWVDTSLGRGKPEREPAWTESIAVGPREYLERVQSLLGPRAYHRSIEMDTDSGILI